MAYQRIVYALIQNVPGIQDASSIQIHYHGIHRYVLCDRIGMAPHPCQLFSCGLAQRAPGSLLRRFHPDLLRNCNNLQRPRHEQGLLPALVGNLKWILLLTIFLGGVFLHISQAILCHLFSVNLERGATAKEIVDLPFTEEIAKVLRRFRKCFLFCTVSAGGMAYMSLGAPVLWRINFFTAIWPLSTVVFAHFSLPVVLNPGLMRFKW